MTDNTQELDVILEDFYDGDIRQSDMSKAKQALIAWHNKQIEEVLDRLESQQGEIDLGSYSDMQRAILPEAIEAERNRLTDTDVGKLKESK